MTIKGWPDSRRPVEPIDGWGPGYPGVGNVSGWPNIARRLDRLHPITLNSSASGAVNGSSFNHVVAAKNSSLLIVVASEWVGSDLFTGATVNGVSGTQLFIQSGTSPSFMRAWYWINSQLPAPGTWAVLVSGPTTDAAAISMLFDNVSQGSPIAYANAAYSGSLSPTLPVTTPGNATFGACAVLASNTVASAGTLGTAITKNSPNALLACAWGPTATSVAFTGTGDARTSIGAAAIRAA